MSNHRTTTKRRVTTRLQRPDTYTVTMHNDDFTTMDFVVRVLCSVFHKKADEAELLMLTIHNKGAAQVATYTYDVAMTKTRRVTEMARAEGFPLLVTCEPTCQLPF